MIYITVLLLLVYMSQIKLKVYQVEVIRSALDDAERNADLNDIQNAQFLKSKFGHISNLVNSPKRIPKPDVIIVRPHRTGMLQIWFSTYQN